ncbi:host attachment protein [Calothrix rhizosoleniae]|uniref:host attachment protein n=1 Tax=Calothrix rhizosoleniae TaxID=888997 RepID=UPI000B49E588|nr:host attachment protein [Calothrix rhizosoleniae]
MNQVLVTVIDRSRARFLILEGAQFPEHESGPNLLEQKNILNPIQKLQGKELWANVKPGRNQGSGGKAHAYNDRRENHVVEFERRFAQMITREILDFTQSLNIQQVLLVAEPKILGIVRQEVIPVLPKNLQIQDLPKDLCNHKPLEIHEHLASYNLLPVRTIISN